MITAYSTHTVFAVKSPFGLPAPLAADLQSVLDFIMSEPNIIAAMQFAKSLTARQQHVLTRLLDARACGLNLHMCGERLAVAAARQFEASEVQRG